MEYREQSMLQKNHRKMFSIMGFACFTILFVATALQFAAFYAARRFAPQWTSQSWFMWAVTFIPLYAAGVPVGVALLKRIPADVSVIRKLRFRDLLIFLVMCFPIMYIGNIVGTALSAALHALLGTEIKNPLEAFMNGASIWLAVLVMVVLAPVIEELVFRKLIIDRMRSFGEGRCVLVSGLLFGLFHGNLSQFFYAFGLGALFAFIYVKTGRLRYTVFLHATINLYSGIITPLLLKGLDLNALTHGGEKNPQAIIRWMVEHLPNLIVIFFYSLVHLALVIIGLVLLIVRRRAFYFERGSLQPVKETGFRALFLNMGMILFTAAALALFVFSLL